MPDETLPDVETLPVTFIVLLLAPLFKRIPCICSAPPLEMVEILPIMLITLLLAGLLLILIPSALLMLLLTVISPSMVSVFDPLEIKIPRSFVVLIEVSISMV